MDPVVIVFVIVVIAVVAGATATLAVAGSRWVAREREQTARALEERSSVALDRAVAAAMSRLGELTDQRVSARSEELDLRLRHRSEQVGEQFQAHSAAFDKQVEGLTSGLREVTAMVQRLQQDRASQHGELVQRLAETAETTRALAGTTQGLREALASPKSRGQWGERMADDVLAVSGMQEGVNYTRQRATADGTIPDFTFALPGGLELNMDVKFPIDNYLRFLEADSATDADQYRARFSRDVRNRIKELTGRQYIDRERTVDYVLMFIPNESVYGFLQENDSELMELALRQKVVLCSPFTLFAVLGVVRQATDQVRLERTGDEILRCLARFSKEWQKFSGQLDKVDKHLTVLANSVDELNGPRRRMLERELARVDDIRSERGLLEGDDALIDRPALREVRPESEAAG